MFFIGSETVIVVQTLKNICKTSRICYIHALRCICPNICERKAVNECFPPSFQIRQKLIEREL